MTARIVIAEDEAIIRMDLREMLEEEGYEIVGEAADGDEAMRLAEQLRPDLVILDIVMPETDGLTAAEHIVEQELAAVLILTAFSHRDKVARATRAGQPPNVLRARAGQTRVATSAAAAAMPAAATTALVRPGPTGGPATSGAKTRPTRTTVEATRTAAA